MKAFSDNRMRIENIQYVIYRKLAFQFLALYLFKGFPGYIDGSFGLGPWMRLY